jgi:hypothetical protein
MLIFKVLYAVVFLLVLIMIAGIFWPLKTLENMEAQKVNIQRIQIRDAKSFREISIPVRNVFDPEGKDWKRRPVEKKSKSVAGKALEIKGVLQLPSFSGVLTGNGFVAVGDSLTGWKLLRVEDGKAVFQKQGKIVEVFVDKRRKTRKSQFKEMGLPFLK